MMNMQTLHQYRNEVDLMVYTNQLTTEQAIILTTIFKHHNEGTRTNIRYLMSVTKLNWVNINNVLNGLVQKRSIQKLDKYWYCLYYKN